MYTRIQVVFDATDPAKLAAFWAFALGYVPEPLPEGFASWEDFGRSIGMPEEQFGDQAAVIDPDGLGPRVFFQRVPEGKTAKNRVHLDVRVGDRDVRGEERLRRIDEQVERLTQMGATIAWREDEMHGNGVVMRDPEGNEFCVA